MEPNEHVTDPQLVDQGEERRRVLRPGTQAEAGASPGHRRRPEAALELPLYLEIPAADAGEGAGDHGRLPGMGAEIGQADAELGEAARVLVRLVREAVPDDPVARRGIGRRRGDVGVGRARPDQLGELARAAAQPLLAPVLPEEAVVVRQIEGLANGATLFFAPVARQEALLVLGTEERHAREVAKPLAGRQPLPHPRAVQVDQVEIHGRPVRTGAQQNVSARQIAMPEPGVVEPPRHPPQLLQEARVVDAGELLALPARVGGTQQVARLQHVRQVAADVEGRPVRAL